MKRPDTGFYWWPNDDGEPFAGSALVKVVQMTETERVAMEKVEGTRGGYIDPSWYANAPGGLKP